MQKYMIPRGRKANYYPNCLNIWIQTNPKNKRIHGSYTNKAYFLMHEGRGYNFYLLSDWQHNERDLLKYYLGHRNHIRNCYKKSMQMGKEIEAYGVYPGGQSGNPGSRHYADFIDSWAAGRYYRLQFLPNTDTQNNGAIKYTCTFHN